MTTEYKYQSDVVSPKLARMLADKGFDMPVFAYYYQWTETVELYQTSERQNHSEEPNFSQSLSAPTIMDVIQWLHLKHEVQFYAYYDYNTKLYTFVVVRGTDFRSEVKTTTTLTLPDCYFLGIEHILTNNLI